METTENFVDPGAGLVLTPEAQTYLRESGKWANFLGIVGFVLCGFILIGALFAGAMMATMAKLAPATGPAGILASMGGGFIAVIYLLIALIYFFFSLYLYQFGSKIKTLGYTNYSYSLPLCTDDYRCYNIWPGCVINGTIV
jgi:hypothetical protein